MTELTVIDQTNLVRPHGRADLMCDLQAGETQCTARSKRTGERCKRASSLGSNVCRVRSAANKSSDGARPVIGPCTAKRPDAGACEIRLYEGVFGRVPESFKTSPPQTRPAGRAGTGISTPPPGHPSRTSSARQQTRGIRHESALI